MKRHNATVAAILAAGIPFQKEVEAIECKDQLCAAETFAKIPDQPHSHEEPPNCEGTEAFVYISTSPITSVRVGSKEYLEILASSPDILLKLDKFGMLVPLVEMTIDNR